MITATQPSNVSFATRTPIQSSTNSEPVSQEPARSFIDVLLKCLSAFNA